MNRLLYCTALFVGLMALAWIGAGYVPGNPLALSLVLLIAGFFLMGAMELHRFGRATASLAHRLDNSKATPSSLAEWLTPVHASLQHAVRMRVEGERIALPGPSLTPYLAGLLVLLGMLGTFLGMIVTLQGTGLALEKASDVDAIRASLAAPVKGLGLAFGTSVAGVAASAMLGLMSALARQDRQRMAQRLDACAADTLRHFSRAHQREESLRLSQAQADLMPRLVENLQGLASRLESQAQVANERMQERQLAFHEEAQRAYTGLASSVGRSLESTLSESTRRVATILEPAVTATMATLARQTAELQETLGAAVQAQFDGMTSRLDDMTTLLGETWQSALAEQRQAALASTENLNRSLSQVAQSIDLRSSSLMDQIAIRTDRSAASWTGAWNNALAQHQQRSDVTLQLARDALSATVIAIEGQGSSLVRSIQETQANAELALIEREQERLAVHTESQAALIAMVHQEARQTNQAAAASHQQICASLEAAAHRVILQSEEHGQSTIREVERLLEVATQAPRAAAELIEDLRQAQGATLERDTAILEERNRLMATSHELLDTLNLASREQRTATEALVQATADALSHASSRFAGTVEAESLALQSLSAQMTTSAAEIAGLGEGFGAAVQLFGRSTEQLTSQLKDISAALGQSMSRSDAQMSYYVAQAREIVDLTLSSQRQFVEDMQRLAPTLHPARSTALVAARADPA